MPLQFPWFGDSRIVYTSLNIRHATIHDRTPKACETIMLTWLLTAPEIIHQHNYGPRLRATESYLSLLMLGQIAPHHKSWSESYRCNLGCFTKPKIGPLTGNSPFREWVIQFNNAYLPGAKHQTRLPIEGGSNYGLSIFEMAPSL